MQWCDPDWVPSINLGYLPNDGYTIGVDRFSGRKTRKELQMHQQQTGIESKIKKDDGEKGGSN